MDKICTYIQFGSIDRSPVAQPSAHAAEPRSAGCRQKMLPRGSVPSNNDVIVIKIKFNQRASTAAQHGNVARSNRQTVTREAKERDQHGQVPEKRKVGCRPWQWCCTAKPTPRRGKETKAEARCAAHLALCHWRLPKDPFETFRGRRVLLP